MVDNHIMVSLGDPKAKHLGEVIGNKSCMKLLGALAEKELTVTELSSELKMPLTTVDYSIKKLLKAGLIERADHWWSVKGKKMHAYRVTEKNIVISPKRSFSGPLMWTLALTGLAAFAVRRIVGDTSTVLYSRQASSAGLLDTSEAVAAAPLVADTTTSFVTQLSPASWFLMGAWLSVAVLFILSYTYGRKLS